MRGGLRVQILLLLGGLLVLAFVSLFHAVATIASYSVAELRGEQALQLARVVASELPESSRHTELASALKRVAGVPRVPVVALYGDEGSLLASARAPQADPALRLPERLDARELLRVHQQAAEGRLPVRPGTLIGGRFDELVAIVPSGSGALLLVVEPQGSRGPAWAQVRLVALYMATIALALLIAAYFMLTRWIVRPVSELSRAAERVAGGARRFDVPARAARELQVLGASLRRMTQSLVDEEASLRRKVAQVEEGQRRLSEAQERLVRSERLASVGKLAAGLAHEIGNPISAVGGLQDLMLAGGLTREEERDFLERMQRETRRIQRVLRDLLQFARPSGSPLLGQDAGGGDVRAAVDETVALLSPQRALSEKELQVDAAPALPLVALDTGRLVQVLLNLVLNAAEACSAGGRIQIRADRVDDRVRIVVEDDGRGVSHSVRPRLFEPFVTTKDVGEGTGLGLAVCRGLVESAGGTIALDEHQEAGARFVIELPLHSERPD